MNIQETLSTPVTASCDVLVCGGGVAGVAAALAAARLGQKVILLEKQYMLGGLGTAGLVTIFLPICDGRGRQVTFGLTEELLRLSVSLFPEVEPEGPRGYYNWVLSDDPAHRTPSDTRFEVGYNAQVCAMLMEKALLEAGVEIRYGVYAVGVAKEGDRISSVIVESKEGRHAIAVKRVIDATGDADVAAFAGLETEKHSKGNSLAAWYYFADKSGYILKMMGFSDVPDEKRDQSTNVELNTVTRYDGLTDASVAAFMEKAHTTVLNSIMHRRNAGEEVVPATIATIPQFRMTRRLCGKSVLTDQHPHAFVEDSIGMIADWRKRGPVFEVPYGALYAPACPNLAVAGRCISTDEAMWDITRVIPCCTLTGEAAGTAAALADDFASVDVAALQAQLRKNGCVIHWEDLK
ncbi:MAG: FAD-dependent oxidoreductase [Clostridia bacterium]|nr:FAD-dependent oxidoreductase [Clostridia bacterium]